MITFQDSQIEEVLKGRQTHTIRKWKRDRFRVGSVHKVSYVNKEAGQREIFGSVIIISIVVVDPQYLTNADARRFGFEDLADLKEFWIKGYGEDGWECTGKQDILAVEFEVIRKND